MLYTLNLYSVVCQLYLNITGRKKRKREKRNKKILRNKQKRIGCYYRVFKTPNLLSCVGEGARTDLRNNEKKLALDMATNAACASLLKKKQGTGT